MRAPSPATGDAELLLRVPAMDCPTEEAQIRKALENFTEIRRLSFDLPGRVLTVDAPAALWPLVTDAIQAAGFKTETLTVPVSPKQVSVRSAANSPDSSRPSRLRSVPRR